METPTRRTDPYPDIPRLDIPVGRFVSLYAGAGGMDIGFALAGYRPVWVNELDRHAIATNKAALSQLARTRPHLDGDRLIHRQGSILNVPVFEQPFEGVAELVIGGPPCQGFSVAGKMDPNDPRSNHVFTFMDVVERVRPKAFVMENVKSLYQNSKFEAVREGLRERADELGYGAEMYLCDASHFGVPQARERMLFIGVLGGDPVAPTPTTAHRPPTLRDTLATLPRWGAPGNDSLCNAIITPARKPVLRKSPYAGMLVNGAGRTMDLDAPAPTLPASMGGNRTPIIDQDELDHGTSPWIVDYHAHLMAGGAPCDEIPERLRRITEQEAAAIQTFPSGMSWHGPQSARFRQIGNAVPPLLAYAAALAVNRAIGSAGSIAA